MFNQKGFSKIAIIIIVLILIGGAYFIFNKKDKNIPAQNTENNSSQSNDFRVDKTETIPSNIAENKTDSNSKIGEKDITDGWKTFTKYGFELKYPAEWLAIDQGDLGSFIITDDLLIFEKNRIRPKNSVTMFFSFMSNNPMNNTLDKVSNCVNSNSQIILECKNIVINGVTYKRVIKKTSALSGGWPLVHRDINIITVFDNERFLIGKAKLNDREMFDESIITDREKLDEKVILAKFDSILPTFKFIK